MIMLPVYQALPCAAGPRLPARSLVVRETSPATPPKPRLLDRVRAALRARHYSRRTEETDVGWIRRYIFSSSSFTPSVILPRWVPQK